MFLFLKKKILQFANIFCPERCVTYYKKISPEISVVLPDSLFAYRAIVNFISTTN